MKIRLANLNNDAPEIVKGMRDFAGRVSFQSILPDDDNFIKTLSKIVTMDGVELWLAENNDQVVGMIGLFYTPYQWNPDLLAAEELFWWVAKDAPYRTAYLLINKVMAEIEKRQAIPVFRNLTTSPVGVEKIYRKHGLVPIETVWARV